MLVVYMAWCLQFNTLDFRIRLTKNFNEQKMKTNQDDEEAVPRLGEQYLGKAYHINPRFILSSSLGGNAAPLFFYPLANTTSTTRATTVMDPMDMNQFKLLLSKLLLLCNFSDVAALHSVDDSIVHEIEKHVSLMKQKYQLFVKHHIVL